VLKVRPSLPWITLYIRQLLNQFLVVTDDAVEVLMLPNLPQALMITLHLTRRERLPQVKYVSQSIAADRSNQGVHMIIHHHLSLELIPSVVEPLHHRHE
jgi:hypothetical protein